MKLKREVQYFFSCGHGWVGGVNKAISAFKLVEVIIEAEVGNHLFFTVNFCHLIDKFLVQIFKFVLSLYLVECMYVDDKKKRVTNIFLLNNLDDFSIIYFHEF